MAPPNYHATDARSGASALVLFSFPKGEQDEPGIYGVSIAYLGEGVHADMLWRKDFCRAGVFPAGTAAGWPQWMRLSG